MRVDLIETPDLGDRSYVISDDTCAVVVDPQRDVDRVTAHLERLGVPTVLVLETHMHNDYVTGGLALARRTGATYVTSARDEVRFERHPVEDGDELTAGSMTVQVIGTPGHTYNHLSYAIHEGDRTPAVFTGGSLLYGSVGRTDLLGSDHTDELSRRQWHSARRLADLLPDETALYPTHGFGSFCSSGGATGADSGTIGQERRHNDALLESDEQAFVDRLVAGLTGYPSYYAHMGPLNRQGPGEPDLSPPTPVDPGELAARIRAGEWVVDLRGRSAYAGRHLAGTMSVEFGNQFSTYVGWILPWGSPITLIGESPGQVAAAQRQLVRIGIDRLAGAATGDVTTLADEAPLRSYEIADFEQLAATPGAQILDVRRHDERAGGYITGSAHIPIDEIVGRLDEVPAGKVWVHCASGYRAGIAASLIDRADHEVVHVDDGYGNAAKAGLPITD